IFIRSKYHKELARWEVGIRKTPLRKVRCVVRKAPIIQIKGAGTAVMNFDPIGKLPVFIRKSHGVLGHEFRDRNVRCATYGVEIRANAVWPSRRRLGEIRIAQSV